VRLRKVLKRGIVGEQTAKYNVENGGSKGFQSPYQLKMTMSTVALLCIQGWWDDPTQASLMSARATVIAAIGTLLSAIISALALLAVLRQLKSAQVSERAILAVLWQNTIWINPHKVPRNNGELSHCFEWNLTNYGKTPAFIDELFADMILIESITHLPKFPKYKRGRRFQGDPVLPGKTMEWAEFSPMKDERPYAEIEQEYRSKKKILFVYGIVKYRDVFGNKHETRFGVRYNAGERTNRDEDYFCVDGPPRYNQFK